MEFTSDIEQDASKYGLPQHAIPAWCGGLRALTATMMEDHYACRRERFEPHLSPGVMLIGTMEHEYLFGKEAVMELLWKGASVECSITDAVYHITYADQHTCTVVGFLHVQTEESTQMVLAVNQRVTFQYALLDGVPKVIHIHCSNSWEAGEPGEIFPFRAGRETYRYVHEILSRKRGMPEKISVSDIHGNMHYLQMDEILYVEAQKPHCILHCVDGTITLYRMISKVAPKLSPSFLWMHRGYIINMDYVVGISRYSMHLCDGIVLPIPEKRYRHIKKEVDTYVRRTRGQSLGQAEP